MADYEIFQLGDVVLQSGLTLRDAKLAYKTYGTLNAARDNAILLPTFHAARHTDTEVMMTPGRALDPGKYFIIGPNMFGNGLSSSPSNTPPPFDRARFPNITLYDTVKCQQRLVTEHLGLEKLKLVVGYSTGAQQAFHWGALYPELVAAIASICGTARTSPQTYLFLDGMKAALTADAAFNDGWYAAPTVKGLLAYSRVFAASVYSGEFFREQEYVKLGLASVEDTVCFFIKGYYRQKDTNDLLAMTWTWQHADISANEIYRGDFAAALRAMVMPSATDLIFQIRDSERKVAQMSNAELRPIPSIWGHDAGFGANPPDSAFIDAALNELLAG